MHCKKVATKKHHVRFGTCSTAHYNAERKRIANCGKIPDRSAFARFGTNNFHTIG